MVERLAMFRFSLPSPREALSRRGCHPAHGAGRGARWLGLGWSLSLGLAGSLFSLVLPSSHAGRDK